MGALTTTVLLTQYRCGFLRHVRYSLKKPLAMNQSRRRFGSLIHYALELYEKGGRRLEPIQKVLNSARATIDDAQLAEAQSMLRWRHEREEGRGGTPILLERKLTVPAPVGDAELVVQVDRLDVIPQGHLLVEYKSGKRVQFEDVAAQLTIQSYAVWKATRVIPTAWQIDVLASRQVLNPDAVRDPALLEAFTGALCDEVLRNKKDPEPRLDAYCRGCEARAYCPRVSKNPKPLGHPPQAPDKQEALGLSAVQ